MNPDLEPAARTLSSLVADVPDGALGRPTPCPHYSVGDLVDHIDGFAVAFSLAARKEATASGPPPLGDAARLNAGWRERIAGDVVGLAEAWRDPGAWTGMTAAGGIEMPAEIGGLVALDELVVHGWDLARGLGRDYPGDLGGLEALDAFLSQAPMAGPDAKGDGREAFGPAVPVPASAPVLDRILGRVGRNPGWVQA